MEDLSIEVRGELEQISKVLAKDEQQKMPFEGIEIAKTLSRIPFFKRYFDTNSQQFINLCIAQSVVEYPEGTDVYLTERQNSRERYLYVVLAGSVEINAHQCKERRLGMLRIFGQLEIVFELQGRQEHVITKDTCRMMRIRESSLLKIFNHQDALKKCLHFLKVNPYFEPLNELEKMQLSLGLTRRSFQKGESLKLEGDGMETVLFFIYGRASVSVRLTIGKQQEFVIDSLEEMSSFGEYECVTGSQTNIKVKGALAGGCYCLNYAEMVREDHKIKQIIQEKAAPYPSNENIIFLQNVKSTLKKQEKRVMKHFK